MLNLLFSLFSLNCLVFHYYKTYVYLFVILIDSLQSKKKILNNAVY